MRTKRNPSNERATTTTTTILSTTPPSASQPDPSQVKQRRAKSQPQMYARQQVVSKPPQGPETQPTTPRRRKSGQFTPPASPVKGKTTTPPSPMPQHPHVIPTITTPKQAMSAEEPRAQRTPPTTTQVNPWGKARPSLSSSTNSVLHPNRLTNSSDAVEITSRALSARKAQTDTSSDTDSEIEADIKRSQSAPRSRIPAEVPARQTRSTSVERTAERNNNYSIPGMELKHPEKAPRSRNPQPIQTLSPNRYSSSPEFSPPESPDPSRGRRSNSCGIPVGSTPVGGVGRGKEVTPK